MPGKQTESLPRWDVPYTFTATFPDETTATASTVLGGAFPGVPTFVSSACGAVGVSRGPTIEFTGSGAAGFEVTASSSSWDNMWRYAGTATRVTVPSNLLWSNNPHNIWIEAYAPSTPARKVTYVSNRITTGP